MLLQSPVPRNIYDLKGLFKGVSNRRIRPYRKKPFPSSINLWNCSKACDITWKGYPKSAVHLIFD